MNNQDLVVNYDELICYIRNDTSPDSPLLLLLDSKLHIITANKAVSAFFNQKLDGLLKTSFEELLLKFSSTKNILQGNEFKNKSISFTKTTDLIVNGERFTVVFYVLKYVIRNDEYKTMFLVNGAVIKGPPNLSATSSTKTAKKASKWELENILAERSVNTPSAFIRALISEMPGIVFWKDTNSVYKGCNKAYLDLFGFESVSEVIGLTDRDIGRRLKWSTKSIEGWLRDDQEVISKKRAVVFEDVVPLADKKEHILLDTKAPIFNEHNEVIGVFSVSQDITEHRKREVALKQAKEIAEKAQEISAELDAIIRYAPDLIYWKDRNSVHLGCNDRFAQLAGLASREDVVGKTDFDLPWKDEAENFRRDDAEVISSGKPKLNTEDTIYTALGKSEIVISNKVPLRNREGEIIGVLGIATEITKLKETEKKLHKAHKALLKDVSEKAQIVSSELDNLITYAPDFIYWKDKNSVHLGCNERFADFAGLTREEVIGKTDFDFPWKEQAKSFQKDDAEVIQSGQPKLNIEDIMFNSEGKKAIVITNKVPLRDKDGKVVGVFGIATDVTPLKETEEELRKALLETEKASKAKSEFIANMSHDIRTPITGMLAMAQDMQNVADQAQSALDQNSEDSTISSKSDSLLTDMIKTIQCDSELLMSATDELLQLCNEILDVTRLEAGKLPKRSESFNLRELIEHNIELLQPVAQNKQLKLTYELNHDVPHYLKGLRIYLDRTLLNLISNALKFTESGFVKIRAELEQSNNKSFHVGDQVTLKIFIEDSGIGIPKDKFETIFEHFSRLTPAYEGLYKGAGLGLYTVKRYVAAMQGTIDVESEVGQGTCFTVSLPFTVCDHTERVKQSVRLPKITKPTSKKIVISGKEETIPVEKAAAFILVVEDTPIAATAVKLALKPFNCAVDVAVNGAEAVKMAHDNQYDLILMDIGLPDFSGIEATKKIRAFIDPKKSQIPIVALTGHANNPEMRQESLDAGMQEVMSKPAQPLLLESILQQYVFKTGAEKKSSHETAISGTDATVSATVIDWDGCVRMSAGDPKFTRKMLSMMADDLKNTKAVLAKAYANGDTKALRAELHRARGGVCYLKLPQLEQTLKAFHEAVKVVPQDEKALKLTYAALQEAMDAFWKTWDAFSSEALVPSQQVETIGVKATPSFPYRILIVEDQVPAAQALASQLENLGYADVTAVSTAKTALDLIQTQTFHLMFTDIGLPDLSGFELTQKIRQLDDTKKANLPIIGVTGHAKDKIEADCQNVGMQAVYTKPIRHEELMAALNNFVITPTILKTPTEKAETPIDQLPSIDIEESAELLERDAAIRILKNYIATFSKVQEEFTLAFKQQNKKKIRELLHGHMGNLSMVGLPRLRALMKTLQNAVKEQKSPKIIQEHLTQVLQEMHALQEKVSSL